MATPTPVEPVRVAPRFVTPDSQVRPPYPQSKLRAGEEALLRLRLAIDARGRVSAVNPVGAADPVFLAAARRHLIAHWRYKPATEDGQPVATTIVITLRFQLDD
jgi:protein TonB